ncbi:MAG TPA: hypothetical protein VIC87_09440 [Vicinamibacteria bacterium]|jgi:hypothetical protein
MAEGFAGDRVLGVSFAIWWRNLGVIGFLGLLFFSPVLIWVAAGGDAPWLLLPAGLVLDGLFRAAVASSVFHHLAGGSFGWMRGVRVSLARSPIVVATTAIVILAVGLAALPSYLAGKAPLAAYALALIPLGVVCIFAVAIPAAAIERVRVATALARSVDLTRGRRLGVLVVVAVLGLFWKAADWLLALALPAASVFAGQVAAALVGSTLGAVTTGVLYHELRGRPGATETPPDLPEGV